VRDVTKSPTSSDTSPGIGVGERRTVGLGTRVPSGGVTGGETVGWRTSGGGVAGAVVGTVGAGLVSEVGEASSADTGDGLGLDVSAAGGNVAPPSVVGVAASATVGGLSAAPPGWPDAEDTEEAPASVMVPRATAPLPGEADGGPLTPGDVAPRETVPADAGAMDEVAVADRLGKRVGLCPLADVGEGRSTSRIATGVLE
jgi:hypothetical protein